MKTVPAVVISVPIVVSALASIGRKTKSRATIVQVFLKFALTTFDTESSLPVFVEFGKAENKETMLFGGFGFVHVNFFR